MVTPEFLHYLAIGLAIGIGAIGAGFGQGLAAFSTIEALCRQREGNKQIFRSMIIGLAFLESGVILALVITLILLFSNSGQLNLGIAIAQVGIAIMMGVIATAISIASSFAVKSSVTSIARQPVFANKILTLMLVLQSLMEAPVVFAFIIALFIMNNFTIDMSVYMGFKLFAATLVLTFGAIGPCIGQALFARSSCNAVGLNRSAYAKIFSFSIINGAVIETPLIFSLLVSLLIIYLPVSNVNPVFSVIMFIIAAFTTGMGAVGPGCGTGFVGSKTVYEIALAPENYSLLFRTNILAQAFIESASIYALIVALTLLVNFTK
ncbi:MAG: hypothetical protein SZ59_C0002G0159 [candidate division TM6 bacterium GW2011_GWF2_28_16]|nr:MAG: hypothetical protein SZ59_C0002G0159 [candidate division TM6 bacterium GW2011_GWF2_28_16]